VDELWSVWVREDFWDFGEQGLVFDLAVVAEACGDGIKAGVVIAGVAEELECAFGWERAEHLGKARGGQVAGGRDAECTVGGEAR
jgi:hypothetical protein